MKFKINRINQEYVNIGSLEKEAWFLDPAEMSEANLGVVISRSPYEDDNGNMMVEIFNFLSYEIEEVSVNAQVLPCTTVEINATY